MWRTVFSAALFAVSLAGAPAFADETIKYGIVGPMSGPFAVMGDNWRQGLEAYIAQHGDTFGGRKIEIIYRDTGADASKAKQLVQELVVRDKVSFLGGFGLTPEAAASAPVINSAKIPAFLFHTASPALMTQSPYFVRMGQNIGTNAEVAAAWALKNGKKTAYVAVADYAPGINVLDAFKKYFLAHGGTIVGEDRIPLNTVDFSPFAERIAAAKPDVVPMFIPPGSPAVGFVKALAARGVMKDFDCDRGGGGGGSGSSPVRRFGQRLSLFDLLFLNRGDAGEQGVHSGAAGEVRPSDARQHLHCRRL